MSDTAFYGPRSRENARLLIDTAKDLGIPTSLVRTQTGGYSVPVEIVDAITGGTPAVPEEPQEDVKRPSAADSKAKWLEYAQDALGLDVTDDNTKAEIIEATKAEEEND